MVTLERRKYLRFNTALHGSYEAPAAESKGRSEIKNLSRDGVQILIDKHLNRGTEIDLFMNVPGDNMPIFARAEVAWNKPENDGDAMAFSTGLRFTKIDRFDKARLLDFVYTQWMKFLKKEA